MISLDSSHNFPQRSGLVLSTLSSQEKAAVRYYNDRVRRGELAEFPAITSNFLQSTFAGISGEAEVIDVGCGFGRGIPVLRELGFNRYLGIDPSRESVELCRRNFPDCQFAEDEIRTIGVHYPDRFHSFFMTAVLMYIPRSDLGVAIGSLRRCLKAEAMGFFSFPPGDFGNLTWVMAGGLKTTLFTPAEIDEAFRANGFSAPSMHGQPGAVIGRTRAI